MPYIDKDLAIKRVAKELGKRSHIATIDVANALYEMPNADVVEKCEVARKIFQEIETCMRDFEDDDDGYLLKKCEFEFFMRELKKKYVEHN